MYLGKYATSMMFHHDHRRGSERRVFPDGTAIEAFGFGCQADVTGSVPSVHSKIDDAGQVVRSFENWNNGMGFVEYGKGDKPFKSTPIPIEAQDGYQAIWQDRVYKARKAVAEALAKGE
jgi:hypothetical protein